MLKGALAAAVTPLAGGGDTLDEDPFDPLVAFLEAAGLDGLLALGTTGEGILLAAAERRRAAELFVAARPEGFAVAIHCGAQTTRETVELSAHAADLGADAVAVIGPPYFALDERALLEHFAAAAQAPISSRCVTVWSNFLFMPPRSACSEGVECRSGRTYVGHYVA